MTSYLDAMNVLLRPTHHAPDLVIKADHMLTDVSE